MTITLELEDDLVQQLTEIAQQRNLTLEELIVEILRDYVACHQNAEIEP